MSSSSASTPRGFYYALYNYHPHRVQQQHDQDNDASDSVASFLRKEAVVDGDFSLTCSRHSLDSLAVETQLRDFISRRLSRGAVYTGSGDVMPVEIKDSRSPLACYFSLLRVHPGTQDSPSLSPTPEFVRRREYLVCYVTDREEVDLLPFRTELDTHAQRLQELLRQINPGDSSQVASDVVYHLQSWHKTCLYFVSRCVDRIGIQLPSLLYSSLCCSPMEISSTDAVCTQEDLQSFVNACSLTALMQAQLQTPSHSVMSAPLIDLDLFGENAVDGTATMDMTASDDNQSRGISIRVSVTPDTCRVSSTSSNRFCEEWAVAMRSVPDKENPSVLRQIIENFKLRANQHMNTLKRLLRNAETDHYTLYRVFVFLETCGMGQILLSAASKDAEDSGSLDSHDVCKVLKEFIQALPASARLEHKDTSTTSSTTRQSNTV